MRKFLWLVLALTISVASNGPACADSDGYFCSATDLLIYELSFSGNRPGHWLYAVKFGPGSSLSEGASVTLPEFQVHGMQCSSTQVEILGWESLLVYDVTDIKQPRMVEARTLIKPGTVPEGFKEQSGNLGALFKDSQTGDGFGRVMLHSTDPSHRYALDVSLRPHAEKLCAYVVNTRLLQMDKNGAFEAEHEILTTERSGECGR